MRDVPILLLANPLGADDAQRIGLAEIREYAVGERIIVDDFAAQTLIRVGYGVALSDDTEVLIIGAGVPNADLGNDGQWYLDTLAEVLWGPKSGGLWPSDPIRPDRGVSRFDIVGDDLIVTYSTGTTRNAGRVRGPAGSSATIDVGDVVTGAPGSQAAAINVGTVNDAVLDFVIPRGDKGDQGDQGPIGQSYGGGFTVDGDIADGVIETRIESPWGLRDNGTAYYDPDGALPAEAALLMPDPFTGGWALFRPGQPTATLNADRFRQLLTQYGLAVDQVGAPGGVATLDAGGKIPAAQLPALAITSTFPVASQAAMLALTAQVGDVAIRADGAGSFILAAEPASTLANWLALAPPSGGASTAYVDQAIATRVATATAENRYRRIIPSVEGVVLTGYGHSYLDGRWNGIGPGQKYIDRVNARLGTVLDNNGVGGYHMQDCVLDAIGNSSPARRLDPAERGIAIVDCITNDANTYGTSPAALTGWENSFRALLYYLSAQGAPLDDRWPFYTWNGAWTDLAREDYGSGTLRALGPGQAGYVEFATGGPNTWVVMLAGMADGSGRPVDVLLDGVKVASAVTSNAAIACGHSSTGGSVRASTSIAVPVVMGPGDHTVRITGAGGSTAGTLYFDGIYTLEPVAPRQVFVPKGVYVRSGTPDATFDAYNAILTRVAAELPNVHVVDTLTGFDKTIHIGADLNHLSQLGTQFVASKVTAAIVDWYAANP